MKQRLVDKALIPALLAGAEKQKLSKPTSHDLKMVRDYNLLFTSAIMASEGKNNLKFTTEDIIWIHGWLLDQEFGPLKY